MKHLMTSYHLVLPVWEVKPHPMVQESTVREAHARYEFVAPHVDHKDAKYLFWADTVQVADLMLTVDNVEFHFIGEAPKTTFAIINTRFDKRLTYP